MTTDTRTPSTADQTTRTTNVLLLVTGIIGALELAFAAFIAVYTYVDIAGMTPEQRTDSWAELGYVFAVFVAAPPALAAVLGAAGWTLRHRTVGTALAIVALCGVCIEPLLFLRAFLPGL